MQTAQSLSRAQGQNKIRQIHLSYIDIHILSDIFSSQVPGLRHGSYNFLLRRHWFEVVFRTPELLSFWGNTPHTMHGLYSLYRHIIISTGSRSPRPVLPWNWKCTASYIYRIQQAIIDTRAWEKYLSTGRCT